MALTKGAPADDSRWLALYWLNPEIGGGTTAVRQKRSDGLWYITTGVAHAAQVLHGPYPSKDAVEMLIEMGAVEL